MHCRCENPKPPSLTRDKPVLCDIFNNDRSDLDAYVGIAHEVEADRVVDVALLSCTVTGVELPLVTLEESTAVGEEIMRSTSTMRFRDRNELERDPSRHPFVSELRGDDSEPLNGADEAEESRGREDADRVGAVADSC